MNLDQITLEDCKRYVEKGYEIVINDGEVKGFEKVCVGSAFVRFISKLFSHKGNSNSI